MQKSKKLKQKTPKVRKNNLIFYLKFPAIYIRVLLLWLFTKAEKMLNINKFQNISFLKFLILFTAYIFFINYIFLYKGVLSGFLQNNQFSFSIFFFLIFAIVFILVFASIFCILLCAFFAKASCNYFDFSKWHICLLYASIWCYYRQRYVIKRPTHRYQRSL